MSKESEYIHKSHNVSILIYHFVCPTKYIRVVISKEVDEKIKEICLEIEKRYEIHILEIGADRDHVHFLIQSVPRESAREIFKCSPEMKRELWRNSLWSSGYFVSSVGRHGDERMIGKYVKNPGRDMRNGIQVR